VNYGDKKNRILRIEELTQKKAVQDGGGLSGLLFLVIILFITEISKPGVLRLNNHAIYTVDITDKKKCSTENILNPRIIIPAKKIREG